jgi:ABC-type antimicrobial peptide transport system permease subunit
MSVKVQTPTLPPLIEPEALSSLSLATLRERPGHGISNAATFDSALDALRANHVRSLLTMLGVIIGVSAVIAVVTLTQGVNQSVNDRFAGLGTNVLTISPGTTSSAGARSAAGSSQTLTTADADALMQVPSVIAISPVVNATEQLVYADQNWNTRVSGVYPAYQTIQNWQLAEGDWFSDQDEQMGLPVAVLGQTVAQNLFPTGGPDPMGQTIRVGTSLFRVVGVLQTKGAQGNANADDVVFVPFSAAKERLNPSPYVSQIQVQIDSINDVAQAQLDITALLRTRHHLRGTDPALQSQNRTGQRSSLFGGGGNGGAGQGGNGGARQGGNGNGGFGQGGGGNGGAGQGGGGGGNSRNGGSGQGGSQQGGGTGSRSTSRTVTNPPNDFQVFNVNQLVQTAQQNSAILTVLLIGIAAISLAVGGIGIMNIMLVSVSERTREIGVRMAVGARRRDVRNQFLMEAIMLSVVGGVIGILIGLGGGFVLTVGLGVPFVLSVIPALIAFSVSAAVGIVFGLYPAIRASKLDPIVALRVE